jgi:hypothetical protein
MLLFACCLYVCYLIMQYVCDLIMQSGTPSNSDGIVCNLGPLCLGHWSRVRQPLLTQALLVTPRESKSICHHTEHCVWLYGSTFAGHGQGPQPVEQQLTNINHSRFVSWSNHSSPQLCQPASASLSLCVSTCYCVPASLQWAQDTLVQHCHLRSTC